MMSKSIFIILLFTLPFYYSCHNAAGAQAGEKTTKIQVEEKEHDFGVLGLKDSVSYSFKIKNTGDNPLLLKNARASCGCTTSSFTQTPIAKNQLGEVLVSFKPTTPGKFRKSVVVELNSDSAFVVFYIKGEVSSR